MEARAESVFVSMVVAFGIFCLTLVVLVIVARTSQTLQDALRTLRDGWRMVWYEDDSPSPRTRRLDANTAQTQQPTPRRREKPATGAAANNRRRNARRRRRPR